MDDKSILLNMAKGDVASYEVLIDKYTRYVVAIIKRIAINNLSNQDIEEITADVFIKLWENREKLIADSLKKYMAIIARNLTLNRLRKVNKLCELDEEESIDLDTPEKELIQKEMQTILLNAILSFSEIDKEIFIRRFFYMQKITDIAECIGIPENTVHTKIARGKKKLEKLLLQRGEII
ncbi:MAG: hypothetical protein BEN19_04465 [Epulopiscium sp. Nuni2H_MBin003]|nr:MAG: hypothetical protein BEN19_04465 [Epulopiscium sp. Nuni2H_MBin003]